MQWRRDHIINVYGGISISVRGKMGQYGGKSTDSSRLRFTDCVSDYTPITLVQPCWHARCCNHHPAKGGYASWLEFEARYTTMRPCLGGHVSLSGYNFLRGALSPFLYLTTWPWRRWYSIISAFSILKTYTYKLIGLFIDVWELIYQLVCSYNNTITVVFSHILDHDSLPSTQSILSTGSISAMNTHNFQLSYTGLRRENRGRTDACIWSRPFLPCQTWGCVLL